MTTLSCGNYKITHSEVITSKPTKHRKTYPYMDLFIRGGQIAKRIAEIHNEYKVDRVVMEGLSFGSAGDATRNLAVLVGMIMNELGFAPEFVPPSTLKKFATGNGRADKEMMHLATKQTHEIFYNYLNNVPKTKGRYDLADAYWLSRYKAK